MNVFILESYLYSSDPGSDIDDGICLGVFAGEKALARAFAAAAADEKVQKTKMLNTPQYNVIERSVDEGAEPSRHVATYHQRPDWVWNVNRSRPDGGWDVGPVGT